MGKRTARSAGPALVDEDQVKLFDVPAPEPSTDAEVKIVVCSECGSRLRSPRSMAAGVSQRCAAKIGVAVLTSMRQAKAGKRRAA